MFFLRRLLFLALLGLFAFIAGNLIFIFWNDKAAFVPANKNANVQLSWSDRSRNIMHIREIATEISRQPGYVEISNIPLPLRQAFIAVEDRKFYNHIGLDFEGILRATLVNIQSGSVMEGGSTITQQLARSLFLSNEQSMSRKFWEAAYAFALENRLSKDKILELYLNTVYFGENAYGVTAAAKIFFNKPLKNLTLNEMTMLAGLPNGPSIFNPKVNPAAARKRQCVVINAMLQNGFISQHDATAIENSDI